MVGRRGKKADRRELNLARGRLIARSVQNANDAKPDGIASAELRRAHARSRGSFFVVILGLGLLGWSQFTPATNYAIDAVPDRPTAVAPAASPGLPPNVHRAASGQLEPDAGCTWLNSDPNDFRVMCR